ncbi:hypothetical protein NDU88_008381 [Pleurodeles waltl]|uniref:Uncharacterized protein n=1 Tax=Pleurodeles waltl TaxID=8319 RepID=A0AAV7RSW1_PLEWA|nr:hypothetical protein NDU88_008381 [Pleurodeles waltl]
MVSVLTGGPEERSNSRCVVCAGSEAEDWCLALGVRWQVGEATPPWIGWILAGGNRRGGGLDGLEVSHRPHALGRATL